jgi:hypothetical protein
MSIVRLHYEAIPLAAMLEYRVSGNRATALQTTASTSRKKNRVQIFAPNF